jgi:hypothetical protein
MSIHPFSPPEIDVTEQTTVRLGGEPEPPVFLQEVKTIPTKKKSSTATSGPFLLALGATLALASFTVKLGALYGASFSLWLLCVGSGMLALSCIITINRMPVPAHMRLPLDVLGIFTLSTGAGAYYGLPAPEPLFLSLALGVLWFATPAAEWLVKSLYTPIAHLLGRASPFIDILCAGGGILLAYLSLQWVQLL